MATTKPIISNGVQEEIALNRVIKALQEITVHNEYESDNHALEFGEKNNVFFVKLDGAVIYAGKDGKHAVAMFYDQIGKIDRDEKNGADPEFSTLREILISRNKHVRESLARLGHNALANSLDELQFASAEFSDLYKSILLKTDTQQLSFEGYTTKNFDMCPTSVEEFGDLIENYKEEDDDPWFEDQFEEASEAILRAMKATDIFLGIEKKVIEKEKVSVDEIKRMVAAIEDSHHFIGELGRIIGDDLSGKFDYSSEHLMAVLKFHEGDSVIKKSFTKQYIPPEEAEITSATITQPIDTTKIAETMMQGFNSTLATEGAAGAKQIPGPMQQGIVTSSPSPSPSPSSGESTSEFQSQADEVLDAATNELGEEDKWHTHKEEEALVPEREATDTDKIVKAIIPGSDNSVLLLKDVRTPFWDLPGGHIQVDEEPEDALHREVKEETGMDIVMAKELMTRPLYVGDPVTEQREITFYWVSATGEVNLSDEHDLYVWAPFDKIREIDLGAFGAILTDLGKKVGGDIPSFEAKEEGFAHVSDASESEVDNVHNYSPSEKPRMGEKRTVQTRNSDPQVKNKFVEKQMGATGGGYSEAGGPKQREQNPIDPTNPKRDNGGRHAMATAEPPASQAFSSGAVIDLPDDEAAEKGVQKNASGGAGTAGDGSPAAGGDGGVLAHSNVSDSTYGGGMGGGQGRPQSGSKGG